MPRPKPDETAVREALLTAAEDLLSRHGPGKVTVCDIATACGMSQSNAYRYFDTKAALLNAMTARWFEALEEELGAIVRSKTPAETRIRRFLMTQFIMKVERFDENRNAFDGFMALAAHIPDEINIHVAGLRDMVRQMLHDLRAEQGREDTDVEAATYQLWDATILIRDPFLLPRYRHELTDARVRQIIEFAIDGIR